MKKIHLVFLLAFFINIFQVKPHSIHSTALHTLAKNLYIDNDIVHFNITEANRHSFADNTFHLFSHGKSGELFIGGRWRNVREISKWLLNHSSLKDIKQLNIYGCEFGKAEKGKAAVAYLAKVLNIPVSASDNITGINGDWILEVGKKVSIRGMENYAYNLQQCPEVTATDPDTDGDGVPDSVDIDDDNDGISDASEGVLFDRIMTSSNRMACNKLLFTTNAQFNGYNTALDVNDRGKRQTWTFNTPIENLTFGIWSLRTSTLSRYGDFEITYADGTVETNVTPVSITPLTMTHQLYQTWRDSDLAGNGDISSNNSFSTTVETDADGKHYISGTNSVTQSTGLFHFNNKKPIKSISFTNLTPNTSSSTSGQREYFEFFGEFGCDTDSDGIPDYKDLDSDNDGIPDAIEANGNTNNGCRFADGNVMENGCETGQSAGGLIEPVDTDADGIPNYLDLDSDADGCSDATEANTGPATSNTKFTSSPVDGQGRIVSGGTAVCVTPATTSWTNKAVLSGCVDTDGDGIFDATDLDDDNDGIPDQMEMTCNNQTNLNLTNGLSSGGQPMDTWLSTYGIRIRQVETTNYTANTNNFTVISHASWQAFGDNDNLMIYIPNSGVSISFYDKNGLTKKAKNSVSLRSDPSPSGGTVKVIARDINGNIIYNQNQPDGQEYTVTTANTDGIPIHELVVSKADAAVDVLSFSGDCEDMDTDKDGIPNRLDLDSDGDGCPDMTEAGVSPLTDAFTPSTTNNSGNSYGITNPANSQLNPSATDANNDGLNDSVDPDLNGTPDYTSAYSSNALSKFNNSCADTDGDGIKDDIDIDDDNDGILDMAETAGCTISLKYNNPVTGYDGGNSTNVGVAGQDFIYANGNWSFDLNFSTARSITIETTINRVNSGNGNIEIGGVQQNFTAGTGLQVLTHNPAATSTFQVKVNGTAQTALSALIIKDAVTGEYLTKIDFGTATSSVAPGYVRATGGAASSSLNFTVNNCNPDIDTDNDGIPNRLDLDSDGDGCTDATEAGTIGQAGVTPTTGSVKNGSGGMVTSTTNNSMAIVGGPYGSNGFADVLQSTSNPDLYKYTYTYAKAIDKTQADCCPAISNNTIGSDQSICATTTPATLTGSTPTLNPAGATILYQWMSGTTGATTGFADIAGATSKDLTFSAPINQTTYYQRKAYTAGCATSANTSAVATITVTAAPSAGTLSGAQDILVNGTTTFSATGASNTGAWSSSATSIATINASTGVITGVSPGTATITYTVTGTGGCTNATATRTVTVSPLADVSVTKTASSNTPNVGSNITFTLTAANAGPNAATGVSVTDILPTGYTFVSATPSSGTYDTTTGVWNIGTLNNAASATLNIVANVKATGSYANTATISATETDPTSTNNSSTSTPVPVPVSGLTIVKDGPATSHAGGNITYTITVGNNGPSTALNAVISDVIPSEVINTKWTTVAEGAATINSGATGTGNNLSATATIPSGNANKIIITVSGQVDPAYSGNMTNQAKATPTEANSPTPTSAVNTSVDRVPALSISKSGPASLVAGADISYTITVRNTGTANALNTAISDVVPAEISNVSWTSIASGAATIINGDTGTGNNLAATLNIPAGAANTVVFTLKGRVSAGFNGKLTNTAKASPSETGAVEVQSTANTSVNKLPVLAISKSGPSSIDAGQNITYTLNITNLSTANADGAVITDAIPAGILNPTWTTSTTGNASVTTGGTGSGNSLAVTGNIAGGVGNSIRITISGQVDPGAAADIVNTATVTPSEPNTTAKTSPPVTTTVNKTPAVSLTKTGPAKAIPGNTISYIVEAINNGPSNASNLVITDAVPATLTNVSWTATASGTSDISAGASGTGNNVSLTGNLNVGNANKIQLIITGTIPAGQANTTISNTAVATPAEPGIPAVNSNTVNTSIENKSKLSIVKSGPGNASAGTSMTYTLTVSNAGPSNAVAVVISDQVTSALSNVTWKAVANGTASVSAGAGGTGNAVSLTGDIPAGAGNTIVVTINGTIDQAFTGTSISNTATVTPSEPNNPPVISNTTTTNVDRVADIVLQKTAPGSAVAGAPITYSVTVSNNGPSNVNGVTIQDLIPASVLNPVWSSSVQGTAVVNTGASGTGNNLTATADIPAGAANKIIFTISGTVDTDFSGSSISNTVSATVPSGITDPTPPVATVVTNITKEADVRISKSGPSSAIAGKPVNYSLTVYNNGPSTATGTPITDNLPAGIDVAGAVWTVTTTGGATTSVNNGSENVSLTADIPTGATVVVNIATAVNSSVAEGTNLSNTATVTVGTGLTDPNTGNNSSVTTTNISNTPDVKVVKTGPATANVGDAITYIVEVTNNAPGDATGILITDNVPAEVVVSSWTAVAQGSANLTGASSGTTNTMSTSGNIPAGAGNRIVITIQGVISENASTSITNKAEISVGGIRTAAVTTAVNHSTDIVVSKAGPANIQAGETISYTITALNNSPVGVNGVNIVDVVPAAITNVSWTATGSNGATTTTPAGTGNVSLLANMPDGGLIIITVTGKVSANTPNGTIVNTAEAKLPAGLTDFNTNNNTSTVTTNVMNSPGLLLQKSAPATAVAGNQLTYAVVVSNNGPSDAANVTINDAVDAALSNVSWTASASGAASIATGLTGTGNNVNLTGSIPAGTGNEITINITGTIKPDFTGTKIDNVATGSDGINPRVSSPTVSTTISRTPGLEISKSAPATVNAGLPVSYTLEITNNGPSNALAAVITDNVPAILTDVTWKATAVGGAAITTGATGSGNTLSVTADIPAAPDAKILVTINGHVPSGATGDIKNQAVVTPSETGTPITSNETTTVVTSLPKLVLSKSGPARANSGEEINYTLHVTNNGPSDAKNAVLTDDIPVTVSKVSWTSAVTGGADIISGATGNANALNAMINVPAGRTVSFNITGTIDPGYTGNLTNEAKVDPAEPGIPDDLASVTTIVTPLVDLIVNKNGPATLQAGNQISYHISVKNTGPSNTTSTVITDDVPATLTNVSWIAEGTNGAVVSAGLQGTGNAVSVTASLPAGTDAEVLITVMGTVPSSYGGVLTNTAVATPRESGVPQTSTPVQTVVGRVPHVHIVKTGPTNATAGTVINYTLTIDNMGSGDALGAVIEDIVPAALTDVTWKVSQQGAATASATSGTGNIKITANIPAGAANVLVIDVDAHIPTGFEGTLVNTAVASANEPNTTTSTSTVSTDVKRVPTITVHKNGPATAEPNGTVTYTITVANTGTGDALGTVITDMVPVTLSNVTWAATTTGTASITANGSGTGNTVSLTGNIPAGAANTIELTITGEISPNTANTTITNTVTVTPAETGVPINSNQVETAVIGSPAIAIAKTGQISNDGNSIEYTFTVRNTGNVTLNNVNFSDTKLGITNQAITIPAAGLAPGETASSSATYIITLADRDAGRVTNTAIVTAKDPLNNPVEDEHSDDPNTPLPDDPTVVTLTPAPAMSLSKEATNTGSKAGDVINYNIVATNTGNVTLHNITVTDPGADAGSVSPALIATLAPGASATVKAKHTLTQAEVDAGTFSNQAAATGKAPDGGTVDKPKSDNPKTPETDDPTVVTLTSAPAMSLSKEATNTGSKAGDVINYNIVATNTGNVTLNNITVTDPGADAGSVSPALIATLAPGASATVTAKHTLTQAEVDAGTFSNQAAATGKTPDGGTVDKPKSDEPNTPETDDPTVVTLAPSPSIAIEKSGVLSTDGNSITYTFKVTNTGNVTLNNVTFSDSKLGITNKAISTPAGGLVPGASVSADETYTLTQADRDAGKVTNTAATTATDPSGNKVTDDKSDNPNTPETDDPTVVTLTPSPSIAIEKSGVLSTNGNSITYTFKVTNTGNVTLNNVTFSDSKLGIITKAISTPAGGLVPGASVSADETYTLTQADRDAGKVTNTAATTATDPSGDKVTDDKSDNPNTPETDDPTVIRLTPSPSIAIEKSGVLSTNGNSITYTFKVTNTGNVTLNNVTFSDSKLGITNKAISTPAGGLVPGSSVSADETYTLTQADRDAGKVTNTAATTATDPSGNKVTDNESDDPSTPQTNDPTVVTLAHLPSITLVKTAAYRPLENKVVYTFKIHNTGNVNLVAVNFNDPMLGIVDEVLNLPGGKLAPNGTMEYTKDYTLNSEDKRTGKVSNTASVLGKTTSGMSATDVSGTDETNDNHTVTETSDLKIPNLFTPNGDGTNDTFEIIGLDQFVQNSLTIVNRWGNEVYHTGNYQNNWTGEGLNEGTYFYLLKVKKANSSEWIIYKGYLTLIRSFKK